MGSPTAPITVLKQPSLKMPLGYLLLCQLPNLEFEFEFEFQAQANAKSCCTRLIIPEIYANILQISK